ncbi:MAG: YgiT-type zinc finger protein [Crenarchaeota archaeon]|nr:YgiT-type zinc finger protein [Thermoproteota archaeon]
MAKNSAKNNKSTKAGALLCPTCCVEYVAITFDFEIDNVVLKDVKALRCPSCNEEIFSPDQQEEIRKRISNHI